MTFPAFGPLSHEETKLRFLLQPCKITAQPGSQVSVNHHRRKPLVFPKLGKDFVGYRDRQAELPQPTSNGPFVLRILERKQETDGNRFGAGSFHLLPQTSNPGRCRAEKNFPVGGGSLLDTPPQRSSDQRRIPPDVQIVEFGPVLAADFDQILKARRCKESHASAVPLQHTVGANRRAVNERESIPGFLTAQMPRRLNDGFSRIVGCREHLENLESGAVPDYAIRKRPARIYANAHELPVSEFARPES